MQAFYAHSLEQDSQQDNWQKLEDHLRQVSALAEDFASKFGSAPHGFLAGLWHDLGKYQTEFQERLCGEKIAIEHSGLGAALAWSKSKSKGASFAFVIAGHHTGLANFVRSETGMPSPLKARVENNIRRLDGVSPSIPGAIRNQILPELPSFLQARKDISRSDQQALIRHTEFWIRLLFSVLVDADRLDTEAFTSPQVSMLRGERTAQT